MGKVNIDALKNKLNDLENKGNSNNNNNGNKLWRPSKNPGETQMRIVPYKFNPENPFIELYLYYDLGKGIHLSPISFGRKDPVVEYADKLKNTGEKENYLLARKLYPKLRTFVPVIERDNMDEGVKFWGFGKTVYTNLLKHFADEDYGDISDFKSGRDIVVEYTPPTKENTYGKTSVRVKPNQTPLAESKDEIKEIMDTQVEITEIYDEPEYDELKEMLQNYIDGINDTDGGDDGSDYSGNNDQNTNQSSGDSSDNSSDDDFDDWMDSDDDSSGGKTDAENVGDRFDELFEDL